MSFIEVFDLLSGNLIPIMFIVLGCALSLRYVVYRSGKSNHMYFKTFTRSVEKALENDDKQEKVENVDFWMTQLLHRVSSKLPERGLRFSGFSRDEDDGSRKNIESMEEFAEGRKQLVHAVKQQIDAFKSPHPPNFAELTNRVLDQDRQWRKVLRVVPVDTLSRILDILPGLFIIGGIFGTFLGITTALPMIADMDLANLNQSEPILNQFVQSVAYAMNTSIAGIVCSVIMTVLNTVFPLAATRRDVEKSLEQCFEFIWHRIHGERISEGDRQIVERLEAIRGLLAENPHNQAS